MTYLVQFHVHASVYDYLEKKIFLLMLHKNQHETQTQISVHKLNRWVGKAQDNPYILEILFNDIYTLTKRNPTFELS